MNTHAPAAAADRRGSDRATSPSLFATWRDDVPAGIVVFLVALPLCLGIAVASGAPLISGVVAGVVGGLVVGALSGSTLMVSGPAAGLTPVVLLGIQQVGGYERFLPAVVLAGILQLLLGALRAGVAAYYVPSSVIKGMLAGIGLTLILKQLPHAVGYDGDYEGDMSFVESSGATTLTTLSEAFQQIQPAAMIAALLGVAVMFWWPRSPFARIKLFPAPMVAVAVGVGFNEALRLLLPDFAIRGTHLVSLPAISNGDMLRQFSLPDWSALASPAVWQLALVIGLVASLESLLSLEATKKLDPERRNAPVNRELFAQGAGNVVAGLLGGLPVAGVMIRSSANVDAGARSKLSVITHAVLMLIAVLSLGVVLNRTPLAAIASVLLVTGYRLAAPSLWGTAWRLGTSHFIPFMVTVLAIVFTDVLRGIGVGLAVGIGFIIVEHLRSPVLSRISPPGAVLTRYTLPEQVTFLSKASIARALNALQPGTRVEIDGRRTTRFDYDALEVLLLFRETARSRDIDYRLVGIPEAELTPAHARLHS
ncbi:MAG: SulP family inorganic anion transporter [Gemmatimonadota bacterium]|nr:SulP family inorganic anion transporter [Gemmatimonadota bacterium]